MSCFVLLYQWKQAACVFLCVWTLSLHTVFGRLIHTVKCVVILAAMLHSIVWIFLHVFIHCTVMDIGMVSSLELLLMVLLWVFWCTSTSHLWKHVCRACTSQWHCWVKSSHELEEQEEKRWVQSVNELMGASLTYHWSQAVGMASFHRYHQTAFQPGLSYPRLNFKEQVSEPEGGEQQENSRKGHFRNVQCMIVKIGCYWFSHVHVFETLPWVRLAYSCLKFPVANGM